MEEHPVISVVVLNWNGYPFLEACLHSLVTQTYSPLEIILVDNASSDGSVELVREKFPQVSVIVNEKNLGFAAGNNVGVRASGGKYVLVLNNDARLDATCIEEMRRSIEKDERFGACASKILLEYEENLLDAAGLVIGPDGLSIGRGRLEPGDRYPDETEVFFASSCACLYRREMLEDIGLYDEDFFAYAEDTDMGWRARLAGWKCIYSPKALVHHLHSASSGSYSHLKAFLVERNRLWVAIKNFPLPLLLVGQFYTLLRYFFQAYGALAGKGAAGRFTRDFSRMELVHILVKVYLSVWTSVPTLLKKRRVIQRRRRISHREICRLLREYGISARAVALRE